MYPKFRIFSFSHFSVLLSVAVIGYVLSLLVRRFPSAGKYVYHGIALIFILNEILSSVYWVRHGVFSPYGLPLHITDITIFIVLITLLTRSQWCFEISYYWGFSTGILALLTPDVQYALPSIPTVQTFISHGFVVISVMIFVWGERRIPRRGSNITAFLLMNGYAVLISVFNVIFKTNYFFLLQKPYGDTLLNYFGPWPVYIITADIFAFVIFRLLWIPFRRKRERGHRFPA